jgi:DNA-binding phage protein
VTESEAVRGLRGAAKRRESADRKRREATEDLRRYAQAAKAAGLSMSQIAREAGVSRQGLYDLLADARPS